MNKRRPLSFLQLQKFEKTKWACFIHFWPLGRDMAIFSFFPQFNSCPFFLRHPLPLLTPLSAQPPKCVTLKLIKNSIYLLRRACLVMCNLAQPEIQTQYCNQTGSSTEDRECRLFKRETSFLICFTKSRS